MEHVRSKNIYSRQVSILKDSHKKMSIENVLKNKNKAYCF